MVHCTLYCNLILARGRSHNTLGVTILTGCSSGTLPKILPMGTASLPSNLFISGGILFQSPSTTCSRYSGSILSSPTPQGAWGSCLGVTLCNNLSVTEHISETITSCQQSLYALRLLRAHGLGGKEINSVFKATTLAKLTYASPAWWGFANSCDKERLEAFLRKAIIISI